MSISPVSLSSWEMLPPPLGNDRLSYDTMRPLCATPSLRWIKREEIERQRESEREKNRRKEKAEKQVGGIKRLLKMNLKIIPEKAFEWARPDYTIIKQKPDHLLSTDEMASMCIIEWQNGPHFSLSVTSRISVGAVEKREKKEQLNLATALKHVPWGDGVLLNEEL